MNTIRPSDVRAGLDSHNSLIKGLLSGIANLLSSIDSYTGESELQGQAFTSHKAYMTEGHVAFLRKYSRALESLREANNRHISAIGNLFESYYNEAQIQNEISNLNRQIRAIDNSLLNRALDLVGADLLLFQNRRSDLASRVRALELKLERLRRYLAATSGIYSSAESQFIEASRLLMVLETATRCPETGRVTKLSVDDAEIQFLVNSNTNTQSSAFGGIAAGLGHGFSILGDMMTSVIKQGISEAGHFAGRVLDRGVSLGRSIGAHLQPRNAQGQFVRATNPLRRKAISYFRGMSPATGHIAAKSVQLLGRGLKVATPVLYGVSHFRENQNVGHAVSYGAFVGGGSLAAGAIAKPVVAGIGKALVAAGAIKAAPVLAGIAVVGLVAYGIGKGLSALYNNVEPIRNAVNRVGDRINNVGNAVRGFFRRS